MFVGRQRKDSADFYRSSNYTFPAPSPQLGYWDHVNQVADYNVQLNYGEKLWMAWYAWWQNDILATGVMSFLLHELVYYGRSLPWMIIDRISFFRKYKIQQVRKLFNVGSNWELSKHRTRCQQRLSNGSVLF